MSARKRVGKARPKGSEFRGLSRRFSKNGTPRIYFEQRADGSRVQFSCETNDWALAAEVASQWRQQQNPGSRVEEGPKTLQSAATAFLGWYATTEHTPTSSKQRCHHLAEGSPIMSYFGETPLVTITPKMIDGWWDASQIFRCGARGPKRKRSVRTLKNHLSSLSQVLAYSVRQEWIATNPADSFRRVYLPPRTQGTAAARKREARGIVRIPAPELASILELAEQEGGEPYWVALLLVDAGLRLGEALALRWRDVEKSGHLRIRSSYSSGLVVGDTKSGRERLVQMSGRLRSAVLEWHLAAGRPDLDSFVCHMKPDTFRRRHWQRWCKRRMLDYNPKDCRSSWATTLADMHFPLDFIRGQLGHSSKDVTLDHYVGADWSTYTPPPAMLPGEVPADCIAKYHVQYHVEEDLAGCMFQEA